MAPIFCLQDLVLSRIKIKSNNSYKVRLYQLLFCFFISNWISLLFSAIGTKPMVNTFKMLCSFIFIIYLFLCLLFSYQVSDQVEKIQTFSVLSFQKLVAVTFLFCKSPYLPVSPDKTHKTLRCLLDPHYVWRKMKQIVGEFMSEWVYIMS